MPKIPRGLGSVRRLCNVGGQVHLDTTNPPEYNESAKISPEKFKTGKLTQKPLRVGRAS